MGALLQDLRFGIRSLRKHLGLTFVAVLSLGLGIGANTTVFTWLNAFVLRPLPAVPDFGQLVAVNTRAPNGDAWSVSYPSLRDWREKSTSLDIAGSAMRQFGMRGEGGTIERTWGALTSGNYFEVLGIRPALGRMLSLRDEQERLPVVVLGYSFWRRRFAGDSAVIGRHLVLNGADLTIVGVAAPRFGGTIIGLRFDLFLPVTLQPLLMGYNSLDNRGNEWLDGVARLRPGVSISQAHAELDALARQIAAAVGDTDARNGVLVRPTTAEGAASFLKPVFLALLGITAVVLLIACANVANLLLARAIARRREIGIRLAMGANRLRLVRQLLTEGLVLGLLAGGVGVVVSLWSGDLMMAFIPPSPFPIGLDITVSGRVLLFALAVTLVTSLVFGLVPAIQATRPELVPTLKDEIGFGAGHRSRLQSVLVVSQVALALVSLVCAGLFIRSLEASRNADLGFRDPQHLLVISSDLQLAGVRDSARPAQVQSLLERLRALPGVEAASLTMNVPLGFGGSASMGVDAEGYTARPDENTSVEYQAVGSDYFRAMAIPLVRGRGIVETDVAGAQDVAVVNERFVARFWPGQDPIGKRFHQGGRWRTVVGVAKQGKYHDLTEQSRALTYLPYAQEPVNGVDVLVRSGGDPKALTASLRRAFQATNADLPFLDVRTMSEHMQAALFVQKIGATMLAGFGLLALALSAIGIYGVMSYSVSQRTREIGVRVALGAMRGDVVGLVVGRAMRLASLGLFIGLAAALGAGQMLRSQLVGVGPRDPVTFAAIALLLAAVAFGASWIPARRASKVDPMVALRYQ